MNSYAWPLRQICLLVVIVAQRTEEFSLWLGQELVQHGTMPQKLAARCSNGGGKAANMFPARQRCSSISAQIMIPIAQKIIRAETCPEA